MNELVARWLEWSTTPVLQALGWTLIQFLWQGAVIACVAAVGFFVWPHSPRIRYAVGSLCMLLMLVSFVATAVLSWTTPELMLRPAGAWTAPTWDMSTWKEFWWTLPHLSGAMQQGVVTALALGWILGVAWFQLRLLVQWRQAHRLRTAAVAVVAGPLHDMVRELVVRLRVRGTVRVLESTLLQVPAVIGWFDPVVLVPTGVVSRLAPQQLRAVLAHELAHLRRRDHLINLLQCITESLLFFHPAVWWLSNRIREDREYCCDDVAVEVAGDVLAYARALQDLEEFRAGELASRNGFGVEQAAVAATGGSLMDRITRLFGARSTPKRTLGRWAMPALLVALVSTALMAASCEPNLVEDPVQPTETTQKATPPRNSEGATLELQENASQEAVQHILQKIESAHEDGHLSDEEYNRHVVRLQEVQLDMKPGQNLVVPLEDGGYFVLRDEQDAPFGDVLIEELHGDGLHTEDGTFGWRAEDGTEMNAFIERHPDAKVHFFSEEQARALKEKLHAEQQALKEKP